MKSDKEILEEENRAFPVSIFLFTPLFRFS